MDNSWISVYSTSMLFNAELMKQVLADNNIMAFVLNKQDSIYRFGDIEVLVKPEDVVRAKHVINKTEN